MDVPQPSSGRRISIARLMFWVACLGVFLGSALTANSLLSVALGTVALAAFYLDFGFSLIRMVFGTRATTTLLPDENRTSADRWVLVDGDPLEVELSASHFDPDVTVDFAGVTDRGIEGRTYVCGPVQAGATPLDLADRGPVLVEHDVYGVCLASPKRPQAYRSEDRPRAPAGEPGDTAPVPRVDVQ
jgi:hypothetical protein